MQAQTGYELDWNSQIENDGPDFSPLPEGEYDFEVVSFERGRHNPRPDSKLPACNKAVLQIKITSPLGERTVRHQLFLHSSTEGMLCAFFSAIGQRKKGEKATMNWNAVTGARGRCKVGIRKWTNTQNGEEMTGNEIKRFLEAPESAAAAPSFQPGRF